MSVSKFSRGTLGIIGALGVALVVAASGLLGTGTAGRSHAQRPAVTPERLGVLGATIGLNRASSDPTGQQGSGGCAVAHHAGGKPTNPASAPPCARLFRTGHHAFETTLGVTQHGSILVSGVEQTGIGGSTHPEVVRSTDQGASWQLVSPQSHISTQDPYVYVDPVTSRVFSDDLVEPCHQISFSDDAGGTWIDAPPAGCGYNSDHQTLFAGPPATDKPHGYPNVVYLCSIAAVASLASVATTCSKSLDGGTSFGPTGSPAFVSDPSKTGDFGVPGACQGTAGHGRVGPDGTVYLPKGFCGQPYLAVSHDEGASWTRVQVADNGMGCCYQGGFYDHEAGVVADGAGNVYYDWVAKDRLPYLAVSNDGGKSWGKPMMIGAPGLHETVLPGLAIGSSGKLAMTYMGSTNSPWDGKQAQGDYSKATWNAYITETTDALAKKPVFYTASINDPADPLVRGECGPIQCQTEGEFISVQVAPDGTPWSSASDSCVDNVCSGLGEGVVGHLVGLSLR